MKSCCCCSVAQSCLTLCDPMNRSMLGLPVHRQLLEFTQTYVIEWVMSSNHLILYRPLLLLLSIFPSIRVFSNESALCIRWPKYWNFSFSISPSNENPGLMASSSQCTWVWASSGSWWWTGKPGVLLSLGLQRVVHYWATKLNWTENKDINLSPTGNFLIYFKKVTFITLRTFLFISICEVIFVININGVYQRNDSSTIYFDGGMIFLSSSCGINYAI